MIFENRNHARATVATGDSLDVRSFSVKQGLSQLFTVDLRVVSPNGDLDFDEIIGKEARFDLGSQWSNVAWDGLCSQIDQVRVEDHGLATYELTIVPRAWLMTQRKNYRIFQMVSELDIVTSLLDEWGIDYKTRVDPALHKPRKYRVQYAETDFAFMSRMLEDAAITYLFEQGEDGLVMVLDDAPHARDVSKPLVPFHDRPERAAGEFVTRVAITQRVRPGKMTVGDLDYRKPSSSQPRLTSSGGLPQEAMLEQFDYEPGVFLFKAESGGETPSADDRGASRVDERLGSHRTEQRLAARRGSAKRIVFESNAIDLTPGTLMSVSNHPHRALAGGEKLLVTEALLTGDHDSEWVVHAEVVSGNEPHPPAMKTPRPRVVGLESATVVGADGEDIHTDEYGRIRVHFHWDRESQRDQNSSCWIPSSQPWSGAGFGGVNLPRVGQEVLVQFLGGDPDRPVVVGRVYTETQGVPYSLPKYKNVSGIRSETTPRLVSGAADGAGTPAAPTSLLGGGQPLSPAAISQLVTDSSGPFQATSPNRQTQAWRGSELTFDDSAGREILYLQAQKDMNVVVKNALTTVVGNHRATCIGTDDLLAVNNKQVIGVTSDRSVSVHGAQTHEVRGVMLQKTESSFGHLSKDSSVFESEKEIILKVGTSIIKMTPNQIIVRADLVHINPDSAPAPPPPPPPAEEAPSPWIGPDGMVYAP
ncbi:MAG: type VI secretion system tip protein TssI/VgrG [Polyangiaceae bacterium]